MEATERIAELIGVEANARIAGYEKGLKDTSHRVKQVEKKMESWRRAALFWGGASMVLVIVVIVENLKLFWH